MYSNILTIFATAANGGSSTFDKILFLFDYILLPLVGLALLFIVYKLIKNKKIVVNREEEPNN